jgi:predicted RNA-binding Zn ribbon-like protein
VAAAASRASGAFTSSTQRQPSAAVSRPPSSAPAGIPSDPTADQRPSARSRSAGSGKLSTSRASAHGAGPPHAADLDAVRAAAVDALGHARLEPRPDGFAWTWTGAALARPLWPIAHAALGLLRSGELDRLAECGHCRWLFLDHSRNRSRRWCSMNACGGREKMRRHRAKGP